jgi:hypothetical protein
MLPDIAFLAHQFINSWLFRIFLSFLLFINVLCLLFKKKLPFYLTDFLSFLFFF